MSDRRPRQSSKNAGEERSLLGATASPRLIREIAGVVAEVLPGIPLHLWGVKVSTLKNTVALPAQVVSVDSAAWNGRFGRDIGRARAEQERLQLSQRDHAVRVALPRYIKRVEQALAAPKQLAMELPRT